MQSTFPLSLLRLPGLDLDSIPCLKDDEIIVLVQKLSIRICWEWHPPHPMMKGNILAQQGFAVEGEFLYDWRHTIYQPIMVGLGDLPFSRTFDVLRHKPVISPFGGSGMVLSDTVEWRKLPFDIQLAFRAKVMSYLGDNKEYVRLFKRRTPKSKHARTIKI